MRFPFPLPKNYVSFFKSHSSQRPTLVTGFVAGVLILATVSLAAVRSRTSVPVAPGVTASIQQTSAPEARVKPTAEALPIQLKAGGFVPREITRPNGDYFFSIQNDSGQDDILLRLERERGEKVHEFSLKNQKRSWRKLVRLPPGNYVLTEANHATWVCRISITAQ
jgi:hypothetical protein